MPAIQGISLLEQQTKQGSDVPVLPAGISHLLKVLNNDDITYVQLSKELESFPSIAIKIVSIANSAWAQPSSPITTLPEACSRIGLNIVRSVSIALSISQVFDPTRCKAFDTKIFWISALLNAEAAYLCARNNQAIDRNTARLTGLLHNIGLLWLANQKPEETSSAIIASQKDNGGSLAEALYEKLGLDYYIVGKYMATTMELPDIITDAIATNISHSNTDLAPFTINHCCAKQISSAVINYSTTIDKNTEIPLPEEYENDPIYLQLIDLMPKIKKMADSIFTC